MLAGTFEMRFGWSDARPQTLPQQQELGTSCLCECKHTYIYIYADEFCSTGPTLGPAAEAGVVLGSVAASAEMQEMLAQHKRLLAQKAEVRHPVTMRVSLLRNL